MKRIRLSLLLLCAAGAARADGLLEVAVTDGDGRPLGVVAGIVDNGQEQWRGLPFAAPPTPERGLRWRPPAPPDAWTGTRDGGVFGSFCPQPVWDPETETEVPGGNEDCLYLNVFRPIGTPSGAGLPVIVDVHGGANIFGQGKHDARPFVADGFIVVTLNHRLGWLGWLAHARLSAEGGGVSGNWGLLDIIAALRWVRANIASFGGDPERVTLTGLSSGAKNAAAVMVSPLARGLFARVAITGTPHGGVYATGGDLADAEALGQRVAEHLGCDGAPDVLVCLRETAPATLTEISQGGVTEIMVDGEVLPAPPLDLLADPATAAVPLLIGTDREEEGFFRDVIAFELGSLGAFDHDMWVHETSNIFGPRVGRIRPLYPLEAYGDYVSAIVAVRSDSLWTCPSRELARANPAPSWQFLQVRPLDDPFLGSFGAVHGVADLYLWDGDGWYAMTEAERAHAEAMRAYWLRFARTGDPSPTETEWPAGSLMTFADGAFTVSGGYHDVECDAMYGLPIEPICNAGCRRAGMFERLFQRGVGPFRQER